MIQLEQQTKHDLIFKLCTEDCQQLLSALLGVRSSGSIARLEFVVDATIFKFRNPQKATIAFAKGQNDMLCRNGLTLEWTLESETIDELTPRVGKAIEIGHFIPAELAVVEGPGNQWLRLYAELVPGT